MSKKQIRTLSNKVRLLEDSLKEVTKQSNQERHQVVKELQEQVEASENEAEQMRQQLRIKSKELKHIRRLSQMILEQRSEVEQFFVEALEQVKLEKAKKLEAEKQQFKAEQARQLRDYAGASQMERSREGIARANWGDDKIHLKDLDAEDRERVLRLLFAKINMAHKGSKPPAPGLDAEEPVSGMPRTGNVYLTQANEDDMSLPLIPNPP